MTKAVYPASFDPIHYGHLDIIRRAAAIFDEVIVGVYDRPMKNLLFDIHERLALAREAVADISRTRVTSAHRVNSVSRDAARSPAPAAPGLPASSPTTKRARFNSLSRRSRVCIRTPLADSS